jgi:hypothetical protein
MIVAFVVAHFSPLFCSKIINLVDAVTGSLAAGDPGKLGALGAVAAQITNGGANSGSPLLFAVLAAVTTFLFAAVAFSFLTRLAVLVIIAITGPLALACHALPQLDGAARLWWRSLTGCLIIPLLQVIALQAGESLLLDPASQGYLFGVPGGGTMNLLIVITLLFICVKFPGLARKHVMQSGGSTVGAQIVRVVVIQQGMRLFTGVLVVVSVVVSARGVRENRTACSSHTSSGSPSRRPTATPKMSPPTSTPATSSTGAGRRWCRVCQAPAPTAAATARIASCLNVNP